MSDRRELFQITGRPQISVAFPSGRLSVRTGGDDAVEVTVTGRRADEFEIGQVGSTISVRYEGRGIAGGSHHVDLVVPSSTRLDMAGASVDVDVERVDELEVRLASGDIRAGEVDGDVSLKTASGDANLGKVTGRISVASASGDVIVERAEGDCSLTTVSGDIDIQIALHDLITKSVSGDVKVAQFDGSRFSSKTMSGDVSVTVPRGRIIDIDLISRSGRCKVPEEASSPFEGERKHVDITCKSVSGDIKIGTYG
ncbi:MAG: DUF4097 domain-containing protein [Acidimicrobiia bacterium]|nr:DUF4097 domain-containing protein [Acidimicrobiia bacterium]